MPYNLVTSTFTPSEQMTRLLTEKEAAVKLQERKHDDWDENCELYRNKVKTNRLTQRQAVNIPLMKETLKTLLSKIDDPPEVEWREMGGDERKELVYQEIWGDMSKTNKLELVDILDKKNVLLYGLSVKKLNLDKDGVSVSVLDVYDAAFDPLMNAWDLESGRFIIVQNIFKSVREILADKRYTDEGKNELKIWANSEPGIIQSKDNEEQWNAKMERLKAMGVDHADFAHFAGGDRIVNLTEHYTKVWNSEDKKFEKRVVVYAEDCIELLNKRLIDLIGVDFWPFVVWSEDPETNDVYPDSVADLVRTPNKVLNVWYSQLIENRTIKNFQMHWVSTAGGYTPQTYTPGPGVQIPAPPMQGNQGIRDVVMPVEISGLDDTLQAIGILTQIVERGTGATAIQKGESEKGQQTLGEVQIIIGKAMERTTAMAKFYRLAWRELAWKWDRMMHANAPKFLNLHKVGKSGKVYPKRVFKSDWVSDVGYEPTVRSSSEQEVENTKGIQKWLFILKQFPNNPALLRIGQKRMLEIVDLSPEELKQVEDAQKQMEESGVQTQPMTDDIVKNMEQNIMALTQ